MNYISEKSHTKMEKIASICKNVKKKSAELTFKRGYFSKNMLSLQKISCTRQFESKLSLRSFALSLQKISCTRQFESKLSLRSFALSLQTIYSKNLQKHAQ
jgi:hypothetical protein